jgi:hypothetical protein
MGSSEIEVSFSEHYSLFLPSKQKNLKNSYAQATIVSDSLHQGPAIASYKLIIYIYI